MTEQEKYEAWSDYASNMERDKRSYISYSLYCQVVFEDEV